MLDFLRKRKRNWVIIFFLGVIVVVFALFYGGGGNLRDQGRSDVAEVNGEIISQREFALHYQRQVERYREMLKGTLTPEMVKGLNLKGSLMEELIQKKLVLQEARSLGLTASDEELVRQLAKVPEFQVAGRFNKEHYLQVLRANKLQPAQFEEEQRDQLTMERLYSVILDAVQVSDAEVRERYRLDHEKINVNFIRLTVADFISQVKLTDNDIKSFYDRNKESLKEPLKLQVEYLAFPYERFTSSVQVSDKEIEEYYQANLDTKFRKPKEAKVRYMAVRVAPDADAKVKQTIWARLNDVVKEARAGKSFAELPKKASDDPTATQEGDAGWILQGQMPPTVDKVIFALAKGGVSDPVETAGGFQIFKVEDTKQERSPSLKEATAEITQAVKTEKAKREAGKIAERDREKASSGADLAKVAQDSDVPVKQTNWFAQGEVVPEIGPNQEFYKSVFSLGPKQLTPIIEGESAYYLARVKQRQEPTVPPLDSVRERIEKGLKESKAYESALQKGNALLEQLKKEKDIAKLATANNLKVEETGSFLRSTPQLPTLGELAELRSARLALSTQQPIADKLYTQKDHAYILALKDSQPADMAQFEKEQDNLKKQALAESRQRALIKFLETLKAKATIKVNNAFLEEA
jgi:peptidyl-prolyl cis-trans isomerase D